MIDAGLVRRTPSPSDRRVMVVEALPMPARTRRAIEDALAEAEARCFASLSAAERRTLLRLLARSADALDA